MSFLFSAFEVLSAPDVGAAPDVPGTVESKVGSDEERLRFVSRFLLRHLGLEETTPGGVVVGGSGLSLVLIVSAASLEEALQESRHTFGSKRLRSSSCRLQPRLRFCSLHNKTPSLHVGFCEAVM